jgi:hypothetical protein
MTSVKKALEAYKKILKLRLEESYASDSRVRDLAKWNMVQFKLWLEAVNRGMFVRNDHEMFGHFGALFFDYVNEKEVYPENLDDLLLWSNASYTQDENKAVTHQLQTN